VNGQRLTIPESFFIQIPMIAKRKAFMNRESDFDSIERKAAIGLATLGPVRMRSSPLSDHRRLFGIPVIRLTPV